MPKEVVVDAETTINVSNQESKASMMNVWAERANEPRKNNQRQW